MQSAVLKDNKQNFVSLEHKVMEVIKRYIS